VSEKLSKHLRSRGLEDVFGLLSGVVRQGSFDTLRTSSEKDSEMKYANQALLQAEYIRRIAQEKDAAIEKMEQGDMSAEVLAQERAELQEKRLDHLLISLYADDASRFTEALATALEQRPGLVKVLQKINAFKNTNLEQLVQSTKDKKTAGAEADRSKLVNTLNGIFYTAGGATIAAAVASEPGIARGVLMGIWGAYEGGKFAAKREATIKEKEFEKNITSIVSDAEQVLRKRESGTVGEQNMDKEKYQRWAEQLRMALNFGTLDAIEKKNDGTEKRVHTMLWYRAHTVLRELERGLYEPAPEVKDVRMDDLLRRLSVDAENQRDIQNKKLGDIKKTNKLRVALSVVGGAALGALGGWLLGTWRNADSGASSSPEKGIQETSAAASLSGARGVDTPTGDTIPPARATSDALPEAAPSRTVAPEIAGEELQEMQKTYTGEIGKGEGVLHGVDKALKNVPAGELQIDGTGEGGTITDTDIRRWKIQELKDMGFVFKEGKWGYPFTVHKGAEVEIFTGDDGKSHLRVVYDKGEVSFHKNVQYKDTSVGDTAVETKAVDPEAGKNAEKFVERMHSVTDPSTGERVVVGREMTDAVRAGKTGPLPAITNVEVMGSQGHVGVTLADGRIIEAYPVRAVDDNGNSYWRLNPVEHSPAYPLPTDTLEVGAQKRGWVSGDVVDGDKVRGRVLSREEYEKVMDRKSGAPVVEQTVSSKSAPVVEKVREVPSVEEDAEVNANENIESRPEWNEEYQKIKGTIEAHLDKLDASAFVSLSKIRAEMESVLSMDKELAAGSLSTMSKDEFLEKMFNEINNPAKKLMTQPEFRYKEIDFGGAKGSVNIETERGVLKSDVTSVALFESENGKVQYLFDAPDGYEFVVREDGKVGLKNLATGKLENMELVNPGTTEAFVRVVDISSARLTQ
jgi:hypothetical protein